MCPTQWEAGFTELLVQNDDADEEPAAQKHFGCKIEFPLLFQAETNRLLPCEQMNVQRYRLCHLRLHSIVHIYINRPLFALMYQTPSHRPLRFCIEIVRSKAFEDLTQRNRRSIMYISEANRSR